MQSDFFSHVLSEWLGVAEALACTRASPNDCLPSTPGSCSPESPPPPEPAWEEQQTSVVHLAGDNFRDTLKRKKHALVMFYAPCK